MLAYPDRGAGNDPEPFFIIILGWGGWLWGSLSQPRLNIFTMGNMRVMICLGQGGLRSLSVFSFFFIKQNVDNLILGMDCVYSSHLAEQSPIFVITQTNFLFLNYTNYCAFKMIGYEWLM